MNIIFTIIIGFVVGLLARAIMPGDDSAGLIMTTLLGIGGAFIGRYLGEFLGLYQDGEPVGFFMSLLGALLLLLLYKLFIKPKPTPPSSTL